MLMREEGALGGSKLYITGVLDGLLEFTGTVAISRYTRHCVNRIQS